MECWTDRRPGFGGLLGLAALVVVWVLCVGASSANAAGAPYLDGIAKVLRDRSPGTESNVWWLRYGNQLPAPTAGSPGWLLQTVDCWGKSRCDKPPPGGDKILQKIEQMVATARKSVDIADLSGGSLNPTDFHLAAGPDGAYYQAIVDGLKRGHRDHPREVPLVRVLVGVYPSSSYDTTAFWLKLPSVVGSWVEVQTGAMHTSPFSWNHAKVLDVDGQEAIVGGMNYWSNDYLDTSHPTNDISMWVKGPAAADTSSFMNTLWRWTCNNRANPYPYALYADAIVRGTFNTGWPFKCIVDVPTAAAHDDPNGVPILTVGKLGYGIDVPGHAGQESRPIVRPGLSGNTCNTAQARDDNKDVNNDRKYEYRNPGETALRALIAEAKKSIFISQQDLLSCLPKPAIASEAKFDDRLIAALAQKIKDGIPIKIVLSNYSTKPGGYSNGWTLEDVAQVLIQMLQKHDGLSAPDARTKLCQDVGLTTIRNDANATKWADGTSFYNHAKLVEVDDEAFYIGSGNLYPSALQELGMIVEDPKAAAELKKDYLDPLWANSRPGALIDPEKSVCRQFPGGAATLLTTKSKSKVVVLRAGTTRTVDVGYPSAFATPSKAGHYCQEHLSGPGARYVKILSHLSVSGGLGGPPLVLLPAGKVCRVKARDNAKRRGRNTTARIKITATTAY